MLQSAVFMLPEKGHLNSRQKILCMSCSNRKRPSIDLILSILIISQSKGENSGHQKKNEVHDVSIVGGVALQPSGVLIL